MFSGPSTASRFSGSLANAVRFAAFPRLRALLPRIRQRDHVVDLDVVAGGLPTLEGDGATGVRIGQVPGQHDAVPGAGLEGLAGEVAGKDVVAGVPAVAVGV